MIPSERLGTVVDRLAQLEENLRNSTRRISEDKSGATEPANDDIEIVASRKRDRSTSQSKESRSINTPEDEALHKLTSSVITRLSKRQTVLPECVGSRRDDNLHTWVGTQSDVIEEAIGPSWVAVTYLQTEIRCNREWDADRRLVLESASSRAKQMGCNKEWSGTGEMDGSPNPNFYEPSKYPPADVIHMALRGTTLLISHAPCSSLTLIPGQSVRMLRQHTILTWPWPYLEMHSSKWP